MSIRITLLLLLLPLFCSPAQCWDRELTNAEAAEFFPPGIFDEGPSEKLLAKYDQDPKAILPALLSDALKIEAQIKSANGLVEMLDRNRENRDRGGNFSGMMKFKRLIKIEEDRRSKLQQQLEEKMMEIELVHMAVRARAQRMSRVPAIARAIEKRALLEAREVAYSLSHKKVDSAFKTITRLKLNQQSGKIGALRLQVRRLQPLAEKLVEDLPRYVADAKSLIAIRREAVEAFKQEAIELKKLGKNSLYFQDGYKHLSEIAEVYSRGSEALYRRTEPDVRKLQQMERHAKEGELFLSTSALFLETISQAQDAERVVEGFTEYVQGTDRFLKDLESFHKSVVESSPDKWLKKRSAK